MAMMLVEPHLIMQPMRNFVFFSPKYKCITYFIIPNTNRGEYKYR